MVPLFPQQKNRWIIAHRGVSDRCPENTRAAFDMAVAQRADAIECDIQLTADNRVVVCHDTTLQRYGHPDVAIDTTTLADLQQLDLGSWFHTGFSDQRIMSIEELLCDYGPVIRLCIELKTKDVSVTQRELLVKRAVDAVETHQMQNNVAFLAFDIATLEALNRVAPWSRLVLNTHEPQLLSEPDPPSDLQLQPWLNGVDGNIKRLSHGVMQLLHQRDLTSLTFTCNSREHVLKAWDLGVDAIITNDPERTREILTQHRTVDYAT